MSNVVSITCTCDYLVKRAGRHRRAGRYDEAMALLWKARNQFGFSDALLMEMARVYEAIGCEEEANRAYLRLIRLDGKSKAYALFQLTVSCAQHGDLKRAIAYYDALALVPEKEETAGLSQDMIDALRDQLRQETKESFSLSAKKRAKSLERRSAVLLQEGKACAAQRAMEHSLRIHPTARGYTMLACCQLIREKHQDAVQSAIKAHEIAPCNVQTLCVLADAYMACGDTEKMRRTIHLAALRAKQVDDLLSVAVESAKAGDDALTLRLTGRILKLAPFHTRAMMIRACAHINLQEYKQAQRLLGRLCGLVPEDSVCEGYYRALCAGKTFSERLSFGLDVTREEGVARASELLAALCGDPKTMDEDPAYLGHLCRLCDWAFHSPMAGAQTKTVALVLLSSLQSDEATGVLLDLLMDPHLSDTLKLNALQLLTSRDGFQPYYVDMDGRLVRLAAGGVSREPVHASRANSSVVQRVADVLSPKDPTAAQAVLDAFLLYLNAYGHPAHKDEDTCAAALEYWYRSRSGKPADVERIAARYGVSARKMRIFVRRFESCNHNQTQQEESL